MQNETILFALMIGTTAAASSDVQPITSARFEVVANICLAAGTASAGSPRVSTCLQVSLWPSTPPALLMAVVAPRHDARDVGPSAASGPVNGDRSATAGAAFDEPLELLEPLPRAQAGRPGPRARRGGTVDVSAGPGAR